MTDPGGEANGRHVGERLSGYLDGELTQQERQRVDLHLAACPDCRELLAELEGLRRRMGASGLSRRHEDEWREEMNELGVKLSRGIGWLLFAGALLLIGGAAIVAFLTDPGLPGPWKFMISLLYLGLLALFVSVLRQRLVERKTDKYKDVEI